MRTITAIIFAAALAGCGPNSLQQPGTNPLGANRLANTLAGRAPGSPVTCLPSGPLWSSERIDGNAIAYRSGGRLYVSSFEGECSQLGRPGYALVTTIRGSGLCSGDIAKIMDTSTGMIVGHCVMGPFVPYELGSRWK